MILLVNTSVIDQGGSIQVSLSFIKECKSFPENVYHILLSENISKQIDASDFPSNFYFYNIKHSPSTIIHSISTIRKLKKLENKISPDCVFTIFGPSYWTPKTNHLIGYAIPHYVYPEYLEKVKISQFERYILMLKKYLHVYFFKQNADYYFTETLDVSKRLSRLLNVNENKVYTIGNTFSDVFNYPVIAHNTLPLKGKNEFRLITISAFYPHKNLTVINDIIPYLNDSGIDFKFVLTIPKDLFNSFFKSYENKIINVGPVPLSHCPYLYKNSDALFLPTFLESFSASYPEAMKMRKPILTSDLTFAHDICGDAAEYFDPQNPEEIAAKIVCLAKNSERQMELIQKGERRLHFFETPVGRARKLLDVCKAITNNTI
jgi:glycosyltransferase involved in cell wall biosynthesis